MRHRSLSFASVALCLLCAGNAAPAEPNIVPLDQEPRHHLVLQNESLRVFDTRIPPGDTTLYHRHERDSVYVLISGTSNLVTEQLGKPLKTLSAKPGDVFFGEHTKTPLVHRFSNLSGEEHHVLDIEIIAGQPSSSEPLAALPQRHLLILENARVRVSRVILVKEEFLRVNFPATSLGVMVVLTGSRAGIAKDAATSQVVDVAPGWFYAHNHRASLQIRNEADDRLELINVEIK